MAFFFLLAGKEIREAMLPGGPLSRPRQAILPLMATVGGMAGPALLFIAGAQIFDPSLSSGWAVPTATDIAFSYLFARVIFGPGSPAIPFLLLLAIADDAGGLLVLALFYPAKEIELVPFVGFVVPAIAVAYFLYRERVTNFWWYLMVPGTLSWLGFYLGGFHPALSLVPLAWFMPHEHTDMGPFQELEEEIGNDTLNRMERWWKNPVELTLGVFGFVNAGVPLNSFGSGTWIVAASLIVGKPLGILAFTYVGTRLGLKLPQGLTLKHIAVVGSIAGIGFTVALFVSTVAFEHGPVLDSVKMGALLSFGSVIVAFTLAKLLGIRRAQ